MASIKKYTMSLSFFFFFDYFHIFICFLRLKILQRIGVVRKKSQLENFTKNRKGREKVFRGCELLKLELRPIYM